MAPAVGVFYHVPGGAKAKDDFFSNKYPWWIIGLYTTPQSIFMAPVVGVGGVTHGYVNTGPQAERVWKAHSQKKETKPLTPIVLPGFCVMNFCFLFFSPRL
jgi:hypothetical protein